MINPTTLLSTGTIQQVTGGNPALEPEKAKSYTAGVVLQPRFLPRFRFSADFYHVKIDGAIATVHAATNGRQLPRGSDDRRAGLLLQPAQHATASSTTT